MSQIIQLTYLSSSLEQDDVVGQSSLGDTQGRQHTCESNRRSSLDVVIERAVLVSVFV